MVNTRQNKKSWNALVKTYNKYRTALAMPLMRAISNVSYKKMPISNHHKLYFHQYKKTLHFGDINNKTIDNNAYTVKA
jgi:hypothetical protein